MARFTGGWTKRHRQIREHWIGRNVYANSIWDFLIDGANVVDGHTFVDGQRSLVRRGQIVTSANEIAKHYGIERKTVQRWLDRMQEDGSIVQQVSHHGRIVTICNYDMYQEKDESQCPTDVPPEGQPRTHILEKEELRKKKEENTSRVQAGARNDLNLGDAMKLARWFADALRIANPDVRPPVDLGGWAYQLQSIAEEHAVDLHRVGAVAQWALGHTEFWQGVITSPTKLAEKWATVTAQCRRPPPPKGWELFEGRIG